MEYKYSHCKVRMQKIFVCACLCENWQNKKYKQHNNQNRDTKIEVLDYIKE